MYSLKIIHLYLRNLNNKLHELKLFIRSHEPDIITLNKTFKININTRIPNYTITQPTNNLNTRIPNYTITQPTNNTDKGVAIIHKNNINIDILEPITTTTPSKNLQHSIQIHTPTDTIQIATLYCPQKQPSTEIIEGIANRHDKTIITGDFNSKHEDFGHNTSDKSGRTLVHVRNKYRYTKLNDNHPTYTNDYTGKQDVKDLIFSSPKMTATFKEFWVDEDLGSDHNTIIAIFSHEGITYKIPPKNIYLYHKADLK